MSKPIPLDSPMFRMVEKQLVEALNTDAKVRGTNALIGSLGTHSRGVLAEILGFVHIPQANVLAEQSLPEAYAAVNQQAKDLADEVQRLQAIINTPENDRFIKGVSKSPADWFHTVSWLLAKALCSAVSGNILKAKHHLITTSAACMRWHVHLSKDLTGK
jgi:NAD(P)H-dependent FMN reductase